MTGTIQALLVLLAVLVGVAILAQWATVRSRREGEIPLSTQG
jgi:hypothetical protein